MTELPLTKFASVIHDLLISLDSAVCRDRQTTAEYKEICSVDNLHQSIACQFIDKFGLSEYDY